MGTRETDSFINACDIMALYQHKIKADNFDNQQNECVKLSNTIQKDLENEFSQRMLSKSPRFLRFIVLKIFQK